MCCRGTGLANSCNDECFSLHYVVWRLAAMKLSNETARRRDKQESNKINSAFRKWILIAGSRGCQPHTRVPVEYTPPATPTDTRHLSQWLPPLIHTSTPIHLSSGSTPFLQITRTCLRPSAVQCDISMHGWRLNSLAALYGCETRFLTLRGQPEDVRDNAGEDMEV
jgi:hypothetical protein